MRIERVRVKVLRQGRPYTNDEAEATVVVDDGDDWSKVEADVRDRLTAGIADHWRRAEAREAAERAAEEARLKAEREARRAASAEACKARDARATAELEADRDPCAGCPDDFCDNLLVLCQGCAAFQGRRGSAVEEAA